MKTTHLSDSELLAEAEGLKSFSQVSEEYGPGDCQQMLASALNFRLGCAISLKEEMDTLPRSGASPALERARRITNKVIEGYPF